MLPTILLSEMLFLIIFYAIMVRGMVLCEIYDVLEPCSILVDIVVSVGVSVVNTNCNPYVGDYHSLSLMLCHWEPRCYVTVLICFGS